MKYLAAFLVSTFAMSTGCSGPCSRIDPDRGLVFTIDNGPAAADYELQFEHAHGLLTVAYTVMPDGHVLCQQGCEDHDADFTVRPEFFTNDFNANAVMLAVTGTEDIDDVPHDLHLTVLRDTVAVHDQVYTPVYQRSEPWGDGCGEAVYSGVSVTLP